MDALREGDLEEDLVASSWGGGGCSLIPLGDLEGDLKVETSRTRSRQGRL